jgi:hypothetical protein
MSLLDRSETEAVACACCGEITRRFRGMLDCDGAQPIFLASLHGTGEGRRLWLAFVLGPWRPDDGTLGAWLSIRSFVDGGNLRASITDPSESPWRDHAVLQALRALTRAEVFAQAAAPEYFFRAHDDLIRADAELRNFVLKGT